MNEKRKIQELINDFATIRRSHYIPGTDEKESDIHHSFSVTALAWMIHDQLQLSLDIGKILKYATIHDMVEVYAGDVNSYASEQVREDKKTAEAESLQRIEIEFAETFPDMVDRMKQYELKSNDEARFVWIVDKIQALVQGKADNYRAFYEQGLRKADVLRVHGAHTSKVSSPLKEYYAHILEEFLEEYDDELVSLGGVVREKSSPARK